VKPTPAFFLSTRRGGVIQGLLVTLSVLGALTVATIFVAPQYLAAQPQVQPIIAAGTPAHQALIDDLAAVVEQSVGVLAIHPRGVTPYEEVVLWLADNDGGTDGRADQAELAVLSHSSVLQTVTVYQMTGEDAATSTLGVPRSSADFCRRWRADGRVKSVVLGRGIANMRIERVGELQEQWGESGQWGALQRLRLTLTWDPDSVDGADEASVLVDTVLFPSGAEP